MKQSKRDLKQSLLVKGFSPGQINEAPVNGIEMVLTLDQLAPNPDNPRFTPNPKYDEIYSSIKERGFRFIPYVTKNPEFSNDIFIFSEGGNTRYSILKQLWQETQDEQFWRIKVMYVPWQGRLKCIIGHLAENDIRGELSYIERALGIDKARDVFQNELQREVSQRELESLLRSEGYPINQAAISRMEYTVKHLYPLFPKLLQSGIGRPQVMQIINLRTSAEKAWHEFVLTTEQLPILTFDEVFLSASKGLDDPELYSIETLKEELINDCIHVLPHTNYDRWLIELDPKEQNRRKLFGAPKSLPDTAPIPEQIQASGKEPEVITKEDRPSLQVEQIDVTSPVMENLTENDIASEPTLAETLLIPFANTGLEPVPDIWHISTLFDDIEHLQDSAYRLAFEIAESAGITDLITDNKSLDSCGYQVLSTDHTFSPHLQLLAGLSGNAVTFSPGALSHLFFGDHEQKPLLPDEALFVKVLRLLRILRRLREQQRAKQAN